MRLSSLVPALLALALVPTIGRAQAPSPATYQRGFVPADLPLRGVAPRATETPGRGRGVRRLRHNAYLAAQGAGGLAGRTVYLSPGHGWIYNSGWSTQRPNLDGYVEDFGNADGISHYLIPWLLAAGAEVVSVRESDPTTPMVVLDDSDGNLAPERGIYAESGDTSPFSDSSLAGFGHPQLPISDGTNPFALGGNRLIATRTSESARATFFPTVPEDGAYNVYIAYSQFSARPSDAHVEVHHAGGITTYLVDQRRHGGTWVLLGRHVFRAGQDPQFAAVVVTNASSEPNTYVSVDAVRLGGGMGLMAREGKTSNRPRSDECARYHIQYAGAPADVYDASVGDDRTDDVGARARFADWVHAEGEEAIFLSYHSNASGGDLRGSETYIYGPNAPNGSYQPDSRVLALGADTLATALHNQLLADLRREIDPAWQDRGLRSAYFGELNPDHQDEMPAALVELAFHDNAADRKWLLTPRFRQVVARALYKGIVHYFARRDGAEPRFSPLTPRAVVARNTGGRGITLAWLPPGGDANEAPTSYRVYRSRDGAAFDDGTDTAGQPSLQIGGLEPGSVHYLRVTALNEAGESLPSPTLVVGVAPDGVPPLLLVGAYTRGDAELALQLPDDRLGATKRLDLSRINDGSQLSGYGPALEGIGFDSCWVDALDGELLRLSEYGRVIWAAGRGADAQGALRAEDIPRLHAALEAGVTLLISGSKLASGLARTTGGPALLEAVGADYVETAPAPEPISAVATGPISSLAPFALTREGERPYAPGATDRIEAVAGAALIARYGDTKGAIVRRRDDQGCAIFAAFPIETIRDATARGNAVRALLESCPAPAARDGGPLGDGGATSDGGGGADGGGGGGSGGCGCRTATGSQDIFGLLLLLVFCLVRRRRSRHYKG